MSDEKMTKEEREIAARCVTNAMKAVEMMKHIHDDAETLTLDFGWDIDTWDIAQAAMFVGKEALGIAHAIGCEDGWDKEEKMT